MGWPHTLVWPGWFWFSSVIPEELVGAFLSLSEVVCYTVTQARAGAVNGLGAPFPRSPLDQVGRPLAQSPSPSHASGSPFRKWVGGPARVLWV